MIITLYYQPVNLFSIVDLFVNYICNFIEDQIFNLINNSRYPLPLEEQLDKTAVVTREVSPKLKLNLHHKQHLLHFLLQTLESTDRTKLLSFRLVL